MNNFISFEGIDGCGKTTQIKLLSDYLFSKNIENIVVREPGGEKVSEEIRSILLDEKNQINSYTETLLFLSSRSQLVSQIIKKNINKKFILCDRYTDSTLAYQGYGRNINKSIINELSKLSTSNLYPDITFLLDLNVEEANKRTGERKDINSKDQILKFENEENIFHQKIRKGFLEIAKNNKDRVNIIDASLDQNEISKLIIEKVSKKLNL